MNIMVLFQCNVYEPFREVLERNESLMDVNEIDVPVFPAIVVREVTGTLLFRHRFHHVLGTIHRIYRCSFVQDLLHSVPVQSEGCYLEYQ